MALLEQKVVAFAVSPSKTAAPWFKLLCFFVAQTTVAAIGALGVTTFVVFVKFEAFSDSWILTPKVAIAISVRFVVAGLWRKPHKGRMLSSGGCPCLSPPPPPPPAFPPALWWCNARNSWFPFFPKTRHFFAFFPLKRTKKQKWLCAGIAVWSEFWLFWWFRWCNKGDLVLFFGARPAVV